MLTVLRPGVRTTVQDLGRVGCAADGIPRSGAADRRSLRLANRLVGNAEGAAALEVTLGGLRLRADDTTLVALAGAAGPVSVAARPIPSGEPVRLPAGAVLEVAEPVIGVVTYLAVRGGIGVPAVLGSRATDTLSGLGPAPIVTGSRLPTGRTAVGPPAGVDAAQREIPQDPVLRVLLGPRADWFTAEAVASLLGSGWQVTADADRVGARLAGPGLNRRHREELPSEGCVRGAIQVHPDGRPTLLGADHPVTGGYPVIAVVLEEDADLIGHLRPGATVRFERGNPPTWLGRTGAEPKTASGWP